MHIITYATHEERYLPLLKQSCPDLVILGMGKPWNGFQDKVWATVEYCKQHPHEIICFIDGFDSIVLHDELLARYETFDTPLVMSHAGLTQTVLSKYIQDKLFGKCNEERLNSGMYIGTSESIISFWEEYNGGDDQWYATQTCKRVDMKIDTEHLLFYNYSPNDTIQVRHGQLYVNDVTPCVISCPAGGNINPYLRQLGYKPPEIHYNWTYRLRTYMKTFLPEIILVCLLVLVVRYFTFPFSFFFSFLLFTTFVEYELHLKHYSISPLYKGLALCIDFFHMFVVTFVMYLLFNLQCSLKKLILLDTLYLIIVMLFLHYKRCILAILQNQCMQQEVSWTGPFERIFYFFSSRQYVKPGNQNTENWMNGNKYTVFLIIALNLYCLYKMHKN